MIHLRVRGLPFFQDVRWDIPEGFVVVTGETGAGKSLLAGAIRWVLGGPSPVEDGDVEATLVVDPVPEGIRTWLETHGFPVEGALIVRRVWDADRRRGRVFIQDTPATLRALRDLAPRVVLFHEQQDRLVEDGDLLLELLDRYAGLEEARRAVQEVYTRWQEARRTVETLQRAVRERAVREEILRHELEALRALPDPQEWEDLMHGLQRLEHGERLRELMTSLQETTERAQEEVGRMYRTLESSRELDPSLAPMLSKVAQIEDMLDELRRTWEVYGAELDLDEEEQRRLEEIRDRVRRLMLRYRTDFAGLMEVRKEMEEEWQALQELDHRWREAVERERELGERYMHRSRELHERRDRVRNALAQEVEAVLHRLRLPRARVRLVLEACPPGPWGTDRVRMRFGAHGTEEGEASRVASGGERARLNLALLAVLSRALDVPLMVLDEIDAAVGGDTAHDVGAILRDLGEGRTVLAITHWPQVAARAVRHFRVVKRQEKEEVHMALERVEGEDRTTELARMLGGAQDRLLQRAARDLLEGRRGR